MVSIHYLKTSTHGMQLVHDLEEQGKKIFVARGKETSSEITAKCMFAFIYLYQELLPALNAAKAKLDETFKNKDVKNFSASLIEFKQVAHKLWDLKRKFKSRRRYLKIHLSLMDETRNKIACLEQVIIDGEQWIKESSMSPAKLEAARKTSMRMRLMWGC
jgi:hypothetical protein